MIRCEETTKERAKHWQCDSEVQSVEDEETTRRRAARAAGSYEASMVLAVMGVMGYHLFVISAMCLVLL